VISEKCCCKWILPSTTTNL